MHNNVIPFTAPDPGPAHRPHSAQGPTPAGLEPFISLLDVLNRGHQPQAMAQAMRHHPPHVRRIEGCDYPLAQAAERDDLNDALDWHRALWQACQQVGQEFAALPDGADNRLARYGWPESLLPEAFRTVPPLTTPAPQATAQQPPARVSKTKKATIIRMQNAQELQEKAKALWLELDTGTRERQGHGLKPLKQAMVAAQLPTRKERCLRDWIKL